MDRSVVSVGIDAFQLAVLACISVSDNTELVDSIADLVLPSAFNGNFVDTDVLSSAMEVDAPMGRISVCATPLKMARSGLMAHRLRVLILNICGPKWCPLRGFEMWRRIAPFRRSPPLRAEVW